MALSQPTAPTEGTAFSEVVPLVCAVALYGPPVVFLLAPWLVLGVMLSGPAAVILVLVAALLAAAALLAGIAALLTMPFRMVRRHRAAAAQPAVGALRRVAA
ncbi:hypothetical protein OJ997_16705 [Solirubrobacter phytolaccae]|uniref:Uncharacterized protein n=1 Tax=Solirubrobacter phytolaccae TaxID=1404360 RepID=A0A9X3NDA4_9ACTN|nr:hypothetical protein [Solirubrobacter phytolaccae]MDA0181946.1 hypothetical protein [Solirubrobacter phytolaccae]